MKPMHLSMKKDWKRIFASSRKNYLIALSQLSKNNSKERQPTWKKIEIIWLLQHQSRIRRSA